MTVGFLFYFLFLSLLTAASCLRGAGRKDLGPPPDVNRPQALAQPKWAFCVNVADPVTKVKEGGGLVYTGCVGQRA